MPNATDDPPPTTPNAPATPNTARGASLPHDELLRQHERYARLRYNVALGTLFIAPALIALPPRKLDVYTFGLGIAWVYCLGEITAQRKGSGYAVAVTPGANKEEGPGEGGDGRTKAKAGGGWRVGWMGEKAVREGRRMDDERDERGVMEAIVGRVWEVWQQKGKRSEREIEEEEARGLRERVEELERRRKEGGGKEKT